MTTSLFLQVGRASFLGQEGELASLLELDGPGGPAYLLTENYRAILSYNCSNAYSVSISLLANRIARR